MSRYKQKDIYIANKKLDWNIKELKSFLKSELIFDANKKGYLIDIDGIKVINKKDHIALETTCIYKGKNKAYELQDYRGI